MLETTFKERPILFSAPMVRAILAGQKTQTRRVMKTPPISVEPYSTPNVTMHKRDGELLDKWYIFDEETSAQIEFRRPEVNQKPTKAQIRRHKEWVRGYRYDRPTRWTVDEIVGLCRYGAPGDRLWVRETHYVQSAGYVDGSGKLILYKADGEAPTTWTPSIHMPRWASRITLEITGVRVERLNDISEKDALAEGVSKNNQGNYWVGEFSNCARFGSVSSFHSLWSTIHASDGPNGWAANPWVWVVEFKRVTP